MGTPDGSGSHGPLCRARTALAVVLAAGSVAAACSSAAETSPRAQGDPVSATSEAPATTAATGEPFGMLRRDPTDVEPLRVAIYGDSVALTVSPAIEAGLAPHFAEPTLAVYNGFGFTGEHPARYEDEPIVAAFPRWRDDLDALVADDDPDLVVVLVGAWDIVDREIDGQWLAPGNADWSQWYESALDDAVDRMTARDAFVVWLGMPCIDAPYADRVDEINEIFRELADSRDEVAYLDLPGEVCPQGSFVQSLPGPDGEPKNVRADDGVHFVIYFVGPVLGDWFADELRTAWST